MATKKPTKQQSLIDSMAGLSAELKTSDSAVAKVGQLAAVQYQAALNVAVIEDQLKEAKSTLFAISTVDLPEAMKEAGLEKFTTTDGLEINVKNEVQCGIPAPRREEAYEWLAEHGFGGIIKADIGLMFDREQRANAENLAEQLRKKGYDVSFNQSVHAQTLKAFVKERMADTESKLEFPLDLFGAYPYNVAVVKPSKKAKMKA